MINENLFAKLLNYINREKLDSGENHNVGNVHTELMNNLKN